jgi:hypothetical protein
LRASETPFAWMPDDASSTIASPGAEPFAEREPRLRAHEADARRGEVDAVVGDDARQRRRLAAAPRDAAASQAALPAGDEVGARCASSNHSLPPAAQ